MLKMPPKRLLSIAKLRIAVLPLLRSTVAYGALLLSTADHLTPHLPTS